MMLNLEKLTMENWGPFGDKTVIEFSQEADKQITYIIGKNGTGKSSIFSAIYWCLFNSPSNDDLKRIVNEEALRKSEKNLYVRLKFYIIDEYKIRIDYDVKRVLRFEPEGNNGDYKPTALQSELSVSKFTPYSNQPQLVPQKEFENLLNNLIPPGPRQFFFLDGEKLKDLFKKDHLENIESYANAISDMPLILEVINNLDLIKGNLNKKFDKLIQNSEDLSKERLRLTELEKELKELNEREKVVLSKIKDLNSLKEELNDYCSRYKELEPHIREAKRLEESKLVNEAVRKTKLEEFNKYLNNNLPILFLEPQLKWCEEELERLREKGEIPPNIPSDILDRIISKKYCICGEKVSKRKISEFKAMRSKTPDKKLTELTNNFSRDLHRKNEDISDIKKDIKSKMVELTELNLTINQLKINISNERKVIPKGIDDKDIISKLNRLRTIDNEISDEESRLPPIRNYIFLKDKEIKKQIKNIESKTGKGSEAEIIGEKLKFVKQLIQCAQDVKGEVKRSLLTHVEQHTSDGFGKLVWDPENWKRIVISENWMFHAVTSNGYNLTSYQLSDGQRHVLGIAFMSSLGKVTGNLLPFVFDSPFGRVSQDPIEKIGKNIRTLMENRQVILLVTDTENANIHKHIAGIIGKEYNVQRISATESQIEEA